MTYVFKDLISLAEYLEIKAIETRKHMDGRKLSKTQQAHLKGEAYGYINVANMLRDAKVGESA